MEFFELVKSPTFWFSTVVMGIIVGVIGNIATNQLQKLWAMFSNSQKKKNKDKEKQFQENVQKLIENPEMVTDLRIEAIYSLLLGVAKLLLYLLLMNLVSAMPVGVGLINLLLYGFIDIFAVSVAISMINKDRYTASLIKEYNRVKGNKQIVQ